MNDSKKCFKSSLWSGMILNSTKYSSRDHDAPSLSTSKNLLSCKGSRSKSTIWFWATKAECQGPQFLDRTAKYLKRLTLNKVRNRWLVLKEMKNNWQWQINCIIKFGTVDFSKDYFPRQGSRSLEKTITHGQRLYRSLFAFISSCFSPRCLAKRLL